MSLNVDFVDDERDDEEEVEDGESESERNISESPAEDNAVDTVDVVRRRTTGKPARM